MRLGSLLVVALGLLLSAPVRAQSFDAALGFDDGAQPGPSFPASISAPASAPAAPAASAPQFAPAPALVPPPAAAQNEGVLTLGADEDELAREAAEIAAAKKNLKQAPGRDLSVPQTDRPTLDGVKRGRVSMAPLGGAEDGEPVDLAQDEFIFLYQTDFKIAGTLAGMTNCDVTFVVLSTLNRRISNITFKLVWPKMSTSLSFDEVAPNTETVYRYSLLGDGCYSMDKIPNVVVSRCRVKGLTQQQCADKIKWLSKF